MVHHTLEGIFAKLHGASELLANASRIFLPRVIVTKHSPTGECFSSS